MEVHAYALKTEATLSHDMLVELRFKEDDWLAKNVYVLLECGTCRLRPERSETVVPFMKKDSIEEFEKFWATKLKAEFSEGSPERSPTTTKKEPGSGSSSGSSTDSYKSWGSVFEGERYVNVCRQCKECKTWGFFDFRRSRPQNSSFVPETLLILVGRHVPRDCLKPAICYAANLVPISMDVEGSYTVGGKDARLANSVPTSLTVATPNRDLIIGVQGARGSFVRVATLDY